METVNRRGAIGLLSAAAGAVVLGRPAGPAAAGDRPGPADLFVLGPFRLGDWFQASPAKVFSLPDAPPAADLIKALSKARVYLIDRRDGKVFADGFPLVVVEGDLKFEWKKGKREWEAHVVGVARHGLDTDNSAAPPTRDVNTLTATLWARETDDGHPAGERVLHFSTRDIRYDLTGAIRGT
jgi:hypothetical protein